MHIIDMTHPISAGMPVWPGDPGVEVVQTGKTEDSGYKVTRLHLGTHTGTHVDAPYHCLTDGTTVDELDLEALVGWAEVLDLSDKGAGSEIDASDLERFADRAPEGSRLLLRTGWGKRLGEPGFFTESPALTEDAAKWLVNRKIRLLGLEQASVTPAGSLAIHQMLLGNGIVLVETLANLEHITQQRVFLIALPLKLAGLDGSPARVIAVEDMQEIAL